MRVGIRLRYLQSRINKCRELLGDQDEALGIALDAIEDAANALDFYGTKSNYTSSAMSYGVMGAVRIGSPAQVVDDNGRTAHKALDGLQRRVAQIEKTLKAVKIEEEQERLKRQLEV